MQMISSRPTPRFWAPIVNISQKKTLWLGLVWPVVIASLFDRSLQPPTFDFWCNSLIKLKMKYMWKMKTCTNIFFRYTHKFLYTHLKKNVTVYFLRNYLGGPDMKQWYVENSLDVLILFFLDFLENYF